MSDVWRVATVGLVGLPNHGKSTLLNLLVGEKVSAVSKKAQTTRQRVTGVITEDQQQVLLLDLPGWVEREDGLNPFLKNELTYSLQEVDGIFLIVESNFQEFTQLEELLKIVREMQLPILAVVTKTDLAAPHPDLVDFLKNFTTNIIVGSAKTDGLAFRKNILAAIKEWGYQSKEPLYDADLFTLDAQKTLAAEFIREQCFEQLSQEVPYSLAVQVRKYEESPTLVKIYAEILVNKESHKPIVIGQGGSRIKSIGTHARKDIEALLGHKVFLDLRVSVREGWQDNKTLMKELGYGRK